jgi:hypothetical protein
MIEEVLPAVVVGDAARSMQHHNPKLGRYVMQSGTRGIATHEPMAVCVSEAAVPGILRVPVRATYIRTRGRGPPEVRLGTTWYDLLM